MARTLLWSSWRTFCLLLVLGVYMCFIQYDKLQDNVKLLKPATSHTQNNSNQGSASKATKIAVDIQGKLQKIVKSLKPARTTSHTKTSSSHGNTSKGIKVAIGLAIKYSTNTKVTEMAFFDLFLNSFCRTASMGYQYYFYMAYDVTDKFFNDIFHRETFIKYFNHVVSVNCSEAVGGSTGFRWVVSFHSGEPARAQNDAMLAAYHGCDCDYYFRVIDDSVLVTPGWTECLIQGLQKMQPPNVGMVAPKISIAPKNLLTVEFVHRTHFEVFGFYYPYLFRQWWADSWMNKVYEPQHKHTIKEVKFIHLLSRFNNRSRYHIDFKVKNIKYDEEAVDKAYFQRYLEARRVHNSSWPPAVDRKKVIAMSLSGNDTACTNGAIRNAQLLPVHFPGWSLRLYIPTQSSVDQSQRVVVPEYVLRKLTTYDVRVIEVAPHRFPPELYSWLALDDTSLDYVLVRNVTSRLSDRDHKVVQQWMRSQRSFHCIRDHPAFVNTSIVPGAFGARPKALQTILNEPIKDILNRAKSQPNHYHFQIDVLENYVWPKVQNYSLCHDSVSCAKWPNTSPFSFPRQKNRKIQTEKEKEFIHASYDEHHRVGFNITFDNEHWWKPFRLLHLDMAIKCQVGG